MITEGTCSIFNEGNVFYNPVQQFNRDLSISVLSTYSYLVQKFGSQNKKFDIGELMCTKYRRSSLNNPSRNLQLLPTYLTSKMPSSCSSTHSGPCAKTMALTSWRP